MRRIMQFLRKYSGRIILGLLSLPFIFVIVNEVVYWMFAACFTEPRGKITNLSGYDFEISYTDCDYGMGAGDYYTSVFASRVGQSKKTLLFKYDSGPNDLPSITAVSPLAIEISIPQIDALYSARTHLDDLSILYKIGVIGHVTNDRLEQVIPDKMKATGRP